MKLHYLSGKNIIKLFLFIFIISISFNLQAGDKIKLKLHQPPPNKMPVSSLWAMDIENTTRENVTIYLVGTVNGDRLGEIVGGKSKPFSVKPGKSTYGYDDFKSGEVKWVNKSIQEIIIRTGDVPEDNYTICVSAYYEDGNTADQENCITQQVQQLGSISLISPEDKAEIDPDTLPGILFAWTPLPKGGPYSLRIVELKGEQSPDVAIKENRPILDKEGIKVTTYQYGLTDPKLEAGKKYAWQVTSGDVHSDIFKVTLKMRRPPLNQITLISPKDGEEFNLNTLPGLTFSWEKCPLCPPMFTLRIVELKGDQSPDVAIKENKVVVTGSSNIPSYKLSQEELDLMKPGKIWAWQISSGDFQSEVRIIKGPPIHPTNPNEPGISLVSPTNGQELDPDTLPGLMFSWKRNDPCPPHVICKYTLRIVELKGDQSPEEAFKRNKPIIEKDITGNLNSYEYGKDDPKLEAGKKYAWQITSGDVASEIRGMMLMLSMQNNKK